jgi:hypothetical protein
MSKLFPRFYEVELRLRNPPSLNLQKIDEAVVALETSW